MSNAPDLQELSGEEVVYVVLERLAGLGVEHPGGVSVEMVAHAVDGWHSVDVRRVLEQARTYRPDSLAERVHEEMEYWRSRYVVTAAGRAFLERGLEY
jgi:hypothetical protein